MNNIKKIFKISSEDERTKLIGLEVTDNILRLSQLKGPCITEDEFVILLQEKLPEVIKEGIALTQNRKYKFQTHNRIGMGGCESRWLTYLDETTGFPVVKYGGYVHISGNYKLNYGLEIWLGDIVELIGLTEKISERGLEITEVEPIETKSFNYSNKRLPEWLGGEKKEEKEKVKTEKEYNISDEFEEEEEE